MLRAIYLWGQRLCYPFVRRFCWSPSRAECSGKDEIIYPSLESNTDHADHAALTILTELSTLINKCYVPLSPKYVPEQELRRCISQLHLSCCGPDSSVGIATELSGWTVRGSNPGGGEIFRSCSDQPWGPPSLLYNVYRVFPGGRERPGRDADPSPPSSAVVKKE